MFIELCSMHLMILGPPTQGHVYQKLMREEKEAELAGQQFRGDAQLINMALKLEHEQ